MNSLPNKIQQYLEELRSKGLAKGGSADSLGDIEQTDAFLCLDKNDVILSSAGQVANYDLDAIDYGLPVTQSLPFLEGLIPPVNSVATVTQNMHIDTENYFDIHFFFADEHCYVVFIDKTAWCKALQKEQQARLEIDFFNEKKRQGNS